MVKATRSSLSYAALLLVSAVAAQDSTQYWHERYHGLLSMAAYGDYATLCPQQTFTQAALRKSYPDSTEEPWTLLEEWGPTPSGYEGFSVTIPEMDKVVMVFKGLYEDQALLNSTSIPIGNAFSLGCDNCTAHAGAYAAYLEAKDATNDWQVVKQAVNDTGHQWSITGHSFGGMIAQVAALDLGWRNLSHWVHTHGSPPVFNSASATVFNALYEGEASQRTVANNDSVPSIIPLGEDYTFVLSGFHIYGNGTSNSTFGMSYENCWNSPSDPNCLGGGNYTDHFFYYTPIGNCGGNETSYEDEVQESYASAESASWWATETGNVASIVSSSAAFVSSPTASVLSTSSPVTTVTDSSSVVSASAAAEPQQQAAVTTSSASSSSSSWALSKSAIVASFILSWMLLLA